MKKSLLVVLMAMVLSACGSSDGNSAAWWKKKAGDNPNNTGDEFIPNLNKKAMDEVDPKYVEMVKNLKIIKIHDGEEEQNLSLADLPEGVKPVELPHSDGKPSKLKVINLPYSTWGWKLVGNVKADEDGFILPPQSVNDGGAGIFGDGTILSTSRDMIPDKGTAVYEGYSAGVATAGRLRLDVDFSEKVASGKVYERKMNTGKTLADIQLGKAVFVSGEGKTGFVGDATYNARKMEYAGTFVGPNAEEVVGYIGKSAKFIPGFSVAEPGEGVSSEPEAPHASIPQPNEPAKPIEQPVQARYDRVYEVFGGKRGEVKP
ncbi:factor H binding protein domain-containing protein [Pasteurella sp. PK-2025]|uniref:factor H binding protein domain-containing protein n=1 Tax=Pasteurella sp. PK-2025 TaxID=3413133 RepID=UPI003C7549E5